MKRRIAFGFSIAVFVAGLTSVWAMVYQVLPGTQETLLSGPGQWVPYEADVEMTRLDGTLVSYGKRYRSSDGSERHEAYAPGVDSSYIVIFNIAEKGLLPPAAYGAELGVKAAGASARRV